MLLSTCLAGCASPPPPPRAALEASGVSVAAARAEGAGERAPADLRTAQAKREEALARVNTGDTVAARRLAEQADIDAQLALSKAAVERTNRALAEVEAGLRKLRESGAVARSAPGAR